MTNKYRKEDYFVRLFYSVGSLVCKGVGVLTEESPSFFGHDLLGLKNAKTEGFHMADVAACKPLYYRQAN